jgi:hypothetical protein
MKSSQIITQALIEAGKQKQEAAGHESWQNITCNQERTPSNTRNMLKPAASTECHARQLGGY